MWVKSVRKDFINDSVLSVPALKEQLTLKSVLDQPGHSEIKLLLCSILKKKKKERQNVLHRDDQPQSKSKHMSLLYAIIGFTKSWLKA